MDGPDRLVIEGDVDVMPWTESNGRTYQGHWVCDARDGSPGVNAYIVTFSWDQRNQVGGPT